MKNILISAGTGLIGKRLSFLLESKGHQVRLLSRKENHTLPYKTYVWNIDKDEIDPEAFSNLDYVIHLAGAGIAEKRWSKKRKEIILQSRVQSTLLLLKTIKELHVPIKAFISSSAIGYYGSITTDKIFEETDSSSDDFLGTICSHWENAIFSFKQLDIRTVALRTGIVLSKEGGALEKMRTPIISPLGNGKQYMPWIHIDDLCNMYIKALEDNSLEGVYNGVAPDHQTNKSFSKIASKSIKRPFLSIGVPDFILKLIFGEMATILLNGSRVSSLKIEKTGFSFTYPDLENALQDLN